MSSAGYRPAQWSNGASIPLTLYVPTSGGTDPATGVTIAAHNVLYVFDGVVRQEHRQRLTITRNPVQTGASLTDHSYMEPAEVTAEILMSDAMQSYYVGQFSGSSSRSVAAYQTLLAIQTSRVPLGLATRLNQYSNMLITELGPDDTVETAFGLKALVRFTQILTANVQQTANGASARQQASGQTPQGVANTQPATPAMISQHSVSDAVAAGVFQYNQYGFPIIPPVPGAGGWSSTNIASLPAQ